MGSIAQEFTPNAYPPFPDGLPSVKLESFALRDLEDGDAAQQDRLFEVCKTQGFFYLDMIGSSADTLPSAAVDLAMIAEEAFAMPLEEKMKYAYTKKKDTIMGYKNVGSNQTDSKGTPDTTEFFNISKDEMLPHQPDKMSWPKPILDNREVLCRYMNQAHETGLKILAILEAKLGLPTGTLAKLHRISEISGDQARMTRAQPRKYQDLSQSEISLPGHTDFGTITILFNWLGGLQVWSAPSRGEDGFVNRPDPSITNTSTTKDQWLWVVPPKPGSAIVNLGDSAVKFTNGVFCSGRHRVVPAPGPQGVFPRYSIVYFVRPEDKTIAKRLDAPGIPPLKEGEEEDNLTAAEWIMKQALALRSKAYID